MLGYAHDICRGEEGFAHAREGFLEPLAAEADAIRRAVPVEQRTRPCDHLGPPTGDVRECPTCNDPTLKAVHLCTIHGTCTPRDCRICRDYWVRPDEPGGMGDRYDAGDHFGLSFTKSAGMALYDADSEPVDLRGKLAGKTAFFLGGGPSLRGVDLSQLDGLPTLATNSVAELYPRPTIWLGVDPPHDPPDRFRGVPWGDDSVVKLVPRAYSGVVGHHPATLFFLRNARFDPWRFLTERTVNWGSDADLGGGRSVMLAALKLLWYFGASRVVLLGADFKMDAANPYAHSAPKDEKGCASNNSKFAVLEKRFALLRHTFEANNFAVVNATEGSALTAFERVDLDDELDRLSLSVPGCP